MQPLPSQPPHVQNLLKKARFWAKVLGLLPGVRGVFLSGSVAVGNPTPRSDVDFFIITRVGALWTARFWVFLVLKLFGKLAKEHDHAGKICPNHFIPDTCLEIQEQDAYAANLFTHNVPLVDAGGVWAAFVQANSGWVQRFGERFPEVKQQDKYQPSKPPGILGVGLEYALGRVQRRKIESNPEYRLRGAKIILNEKELRFHPKPKNVGFHQ